MTKSVYLLRIFGFFRDFEFGEFEVGIVFLNVLFPKFENVVSGKSFERNESRLWLVQTQLAMQNS